MRERHIARSTANVNLGITPACAGTTPAILFITTSRKDHPRLCGNDVSNIDRFFQNGGSPPLVRERPVVYDTAVCCLGITPACAGTTPIFSEGLPCVEDHPRLCGNDSLLSWQSFFIEGSPPLVRERLNSGLPVPSIGRITPACAGTTSRATKSGRRKKDHPRLCGNDWTATPSIKGTAGSPPLVRERP